MTEVRGIPQADGHCCGGDGADSAPAVPALVEGLDYNQGLVEGEPREEEDEDDDGVDEEGMARLMKALGDDLDDFAKAQISSLRPT